MKIELKRIEYSARMSEETPCFTADLYIEGKKVGTASNNGKGGNTFYEGTTAEGMDVIRQAEQYFNAKDGTRNLEEKIDDLVDDFINEKERIKFEKKLEKKMEKGVVFGIPGDTSFTSITYDITLKELLVRPLGTTKLVALIVNKVLPELKGGVMILNTNIPAEVIRRVGLEEGQYVKQVEPPAPKETLRPQKKPGRKL